jgi:hypothetical protein
MASKLRPFRDYSEHDVINLFAHTNDTCDAGVIVKLNAAGNAWGHNGWVNIDASTKLSNENAMLGNAGSNSITNTVSERYGVTARVQTAGTTDLPLGMALYSVAETDENGEKLIYNPRKAAEMQVVVSGQALPVVTKGLFLYDYGTADTAIGGYNARVGSDGSVVTGNENEGALVGTWLGDSDANGHALLRLNIDMNTGSHMTG